jgi:hypothetical protein
MEELSSAMDNL